MTATEWMEEWLKEFPSTKTLVETLRRGEHGVPQSADWEIKNILEGI